MRMARPFLASVPLALVLLASLIVPVALTPGTFGFHNWPTAAPERVVRDSLPTAPSPAPVAVAPERRQSHRHTGKPSRAARKLVAVRTGDGRSAAPGGSTPAGAGPASPAPSTGSSTAPPAGSDGPGGATRDTTPDQAPGTGTPALPAPATPAADAIGEAPVAPVEVAQNGDVPVLREDSPEPVAEPPAEEDDSDWWHPRRRSGHHHERHCAEGDQEAPTASS